MRIPSCAASYRSVMLELVSCIALFICIIFPLRGVDAAGEPCTRPDGTCFGPITIHSPTQGDLGTCSPTLATCWMNCMKINCCRSFELNGGGTCQLSFSTGLAYVKEFPTPMTANQCFQQFQTCTQTAGVDSPANSASFESVFVNSQSLVSTIEIWTKTGDSNGNNGLLSGIHFTYPNNPVATFETMAGYGGHASAGVCNINEPITKVTTYSGSLVVGGNTYPVVGGIEFVTSSGVRCGPFGRTTGSQQTFSGKALLYLFGQAGMGVDKIDFTFDSC